jgi:DNA-binding NtrC family response regulator
MTSELSLQLREATTPDPDQGASDAFWATQTDIADIYTDDEKKLIRKYASIPKNVLILGESGSGKEVVAELIRRMSPRAHQPFIVVNCAGIPETLLESELFGHTRGAFTGATEEKRGKFEEANRGIIFLDEIGEFSHAMQAKLLRVLEHKEFQRVGSNRTIEVDIQIVAATNRNLEQAIENGSFRADLYYRLAALSFRTRPFRKYAEDEKRTMIAFLVKSIIATLPPEHAAKRLSEKAEHTILAKGWPGNIRQLKNTIERAIIGTDNNIIQKKDLIIEDGFAHIEDLLSEDALMRKFIAAVRRNGGEGTLAARTMTSLLVHAVELKGGNVKATAKMLGISRGTLSRQYETATGRRISDDYPHGHRGPALE